MSMDQTVKFIDAWEESAMNDHGYTRTIVMGNALAEPGQSSPACPQRHSQQSTHQTQSPQQQVIIQGGQDSECNDDVMLIDERPPNQHPPTPNAQRQKIMNNSNLHQLSGQGTHQVAGCSEQGRTYLVFDNTGQHQHGQNVSSAVNVRGRSPGQHTTGKQNFGLNLTALQAERIRNSPELQNLLKQQIQQQHQQQEINTEQVAQGQSRASAEQQMKLQHAQQQTHFSQHQAQPGLNIQQQQSSSQLGLVPGQNQGHVLASPAQTLAVSTQSPRVRMTKQPNIISRVVHQKVTPKTPTNIIRPAKLHVGERDLDIRQGVPQQHQGGQGVNVQLVEQIREMTANKQSPTPQNKLLPSARQFVKTPKKRPQSKLQTAKKQNDLPNTDILRQRLSAESSGMSRTTDVRVANSSQITHTPQPRLVPKGTSAQAVQYLINRGDHASQGGSSNVAQIHPQGSRAQTIMVNSQGQAVPAAQLVKSNSKMIRYVVPTSQVQQMVVQSPSRGQMVVQSPSHGQMVVQSPSQGQMVVQSPSHGQMQVVVQSPSQGQMIVQSLSQGHMVVQSPSNSQMVVQGASQGRMAVQSTTQGQMESQSPSQGQMVVQSSSQGQMVGQSHSQGQMVGHSHSQGQMVVQRQLQGQGIVQNPSQAQGLANAAVTQNLSYQSSPQFHRAMMQTNMPSPAQAMNPGCQVQQSPGCGLRTQSPLVAMRSQGSYHTATRGPHNTLPSSQSAPMALSPVCSQKVSSSTDTTSESASPGLPPNNQPKISPIDPANSIGEEQVPGEKQSAQYVKGQTYAIKYNNGITLEVVWDGKFFKPKGQCNLTGQVAGSTLQTVVASPDGNDQLSPPATPGLETSEEETPGASLSGASPGLSAASLDEAGQVRGGGGGDKQQQRKILMRGNTTGLNMAHKTPPATTVNSSMVNGSRKWNHSSVGKDKLSRPPIHPEEEAESEPPKPPRVKKPKEDGKFAVCNHCGNLSSDYNYCESCHKPLPDDPKYYYPSHPEKNLGPKAPASPLVPTTIPNTVVYTIQTMPSKTDGTLVNKAKFYGKKSVAMQIVPPLKTLRATKRRGVPQTGVRGQKRKYMKKISEPETVTILSSDDEEAGQGNRSMSGPGTPVPDSQPGTPIPTNTGIPTPPTQQTQSRRFKMEDSSGKIVMPRQQSVNTPSPTERVQPAMVPQDTAYLQHTRSVKLGSLRTVAPKGVEFTPQGICMGLVPEGEEANTSPIQVVLAVDDLVHIQVNFGRQFPLMGIYVNPKCAHRLRIKFNMTDKGPFFDPCSSEDSHKRIILLTSEFPKEFIEKVKELCEYYETKNSICTKPLLEEISNQAANGLMMSSTPKAVVNSIKEQQGNIVARQKSTTHTVYGQLVINTPGQNQMTLITTIPVATEHRDLNEEEEDDEPVDRSRSPSPILNVFTGPIIKLFTFPPPPATGGITVTNEDLFCLQEGEFLNDVIIDFYLKYLFTKCLSPEDQARTHVFSSFFYRRLTQKDNKRRMGEETQKLTQQERRHHRVRTWTRHVDLFSKDFIIVPINESAHWYLAIICFPYLKEPVVFKKTMAVQTKVPESATKSATPKPSSSQSDAEKAFLSDLKGIKEGEPAAPIDTSSNKITDKKMTTETPSKTKTVMSKIVVSGIQKQPCILVFDSLSGPSRSCVVRTLREYLQVEWDIKKSSKEGKRSFDKDTVKGANPKCPQQTNYSDCGVYVLEYVESFFKRPITDYAVPIRTLSDWFTDEQVAAKRQELRELILKLQKILSPNLDYEPSPEDLGLFDTQQGAVLNPQTDLVDNTPIEQTTLKEELPPLKEELTPKEDL